MITRTLSEREMEVLGLMAQGLSQRGVADRLCVSINTVKTHLRNVYNKLGIEGRNGTNSPVVLAVQWYSENRSTEKRGV